ncbi:transmembrane anchor protein [Kiloniella sp.]|uniref:transmembrane anchor protein n=1 Tax=Kiloniella sp. TaxID=1938587 RepID=UPI003B0113AC
MHNAPIPKLEDLPSKAQLRRYSFIAGIGAVAIGVMVYMPAELGQDPTGVGSLLGLTNMGEIKQQLLKEAGNDAEHQEGDGASFLLQQIQGLFVSTAYAQEVRQDEITFTLAPGDYSEIKVTMEKGAELMYSWKAEGGRINFDLHAHAGGEAVTYEKGRGQISGTGSFITPFAGDHGWFWRNRDGENVTVTLQLSGDYTAIVRGK